MQNKNSKCKIKNQIAIDDQKMKSVITTSAYKQLFEAEKALESAWNSLSNIEKSIKSCVLDLGLWSNTLSTQGFNDYNSTRTKIAQYLSKTIKYYSISGYKVIGGK